MRLEDERDMTDGGNTELAPSAFRVRDAVDRVERRSRRPASTIAICAELRFVIPEGTVRHYLRQLEQCGEIYRRSERSGWRIRPEGAAVKAWEPRKAGKQWWDRRWWERTRQLALPFMVEVRRQVERVRTARPRPAVDTSGLPVQLALPRFAA